MDEVAIVGDGLAKRFSAGVCAHIGEHRRADRLSRAE